MNAAQYWVRLGCFLAASVNISANAAFDVPYNVTPPAPGIYEGFPFNWVYTYGNWTASGARMAVNTMESPDRLGLAVAAISATGASLRFETRSAGDGIVLFDAAAISTTPGQISWFQLRDGGPSIFVWLDNGISGQSIHHQFAVQAGEVFGFDLSGGGDVVQPGGPLAHSLTLENFSVPVPEPGSWALLGSGIVFVAARKFIKR